MKVALIDPSLFTPPYDRALMEGLRRAGNIVRLYTRYRARTEPPETDADVVQHFYPFLARQSPLGLPPLAQRVLKAVSHGPAMRRLIARLREWDPEIIHFQWLPLPLLDHIFLEAFRRIAPLVVTVHDSIPFNGSPVAGIQHWGSQSIYARFDQLIVHTDRAFSRLAAEGVAVRKITKIPHGLLNEGLRNLDAIDNTVRPAGAAVDVLFFGKIKPYKGVDVLIRALSLLPAKERAKCRVRVVGKPYMDSNSLVNLAVSLGVMDRLHFDFRFVEDEEIPEIFAPASVVVLPYREIDASGVLMTAVAAGRPIVATTIGSFAELLSEDSNALLVPPNDDRALAGALSRVITDEALRARLAAGVRKLRDTTPNWDNIGRSTHAVYERLINTR
jgi:glycosyltransferase involved in cell wall biosynthesis